MKTYLTVMAHSLYSIIPYKNDLLKFSKAINARAYYKDHYIDLMTGTTHNFEIQKWVQSLDFPVHKHDIKKRFIHLFYELGFLFEGSLSDIQASDLLALDIEYGEVKKHWLKKDTQLSKISLSLQSAPDFSDYQKQFEEGYSELKAGNCYQFNLTGQYVYSIHKKVAPMDFVETLWRKKQDRGAYASATYIEFFDKMFLSNSPECLFQYDKEDLVTRPVKGTLRRESDNKEEVKKLWQTLVDDEKNQAELYMITDLLRNDVCRIDLPQAEVIKKKAMLLVPGLIHQYAEIKVNLRNHVTLKNILEKIFPGGSITGAPKKRVMEILKKLEGRSRGFYCGSTLIFSPGRVDASINIRSSVIDFRNNTLSYQSGSGITLLSDVNHEFEEMNDKRDSYMNTLTL